MKMNPINSAILLSALCLAACGSSSNSDTSSDQNSNQTPTEQDNSLSEQTKALGISSIPSNLASTYTSALNFNRYTSVETPNGGAIHIVAQNQITDNQIVRARSVLQHFLTPYPGSQYGEDKSAVANKMADNGAVLMLLNGVDDGSNQASELGGQPLYSGEMQVEGHQWYISQNYEHRDATFEEILHLVHDNGIGVDQNSSFIGALPDYQAEIRSAQVDALSGSIWGMGAQGWISELTAENSLSQEYLASVIDVYYGLWGANTEFADTGMYSLYAAKIRSDMATEDPQGAALMDNKFFHPYLTYNARIDESFNGDFSLKFNPELAYTHHAQYLKDITLTGENASNVVVNQYDNIITGNSAENTVIFSGNSSEYQIDTDMDVVTVTDLQDNRDGSNQLKAIENLQFTDMTMDVSGN